MENVPGALVDPHWFFHLALGPPSSFFLCLFDFLWDISSSAGEVLVHRSGAAETDGRKETEPNLTKGPDRRLNIIFMLKVENSKTRRSGHETQMMSGVGVSVLQHIDHSCSV